MLKRFLVLIIFAVLIGVATRAFGQIAEDDARPITRAGAVALLVESDPMLKSRLQYHIKAQHPLPLFNDLDYAQWYAPYVETAFEAGLLTGNSEAMFYPSQYLAEEEAIALGARYHVMHHPEKLPSLNAEGEGWFNRYVTASVQNGIDLPNPIRLGQPIKRSDLYAMMISLDIQHPSQITLSHQPPPVIAAAAHIQRVVQPRPINSIVRTTTVAAVTPSTPTAQSATQQPSTKAFAISMPSLGIKDLTITHPSDPFTKEGLLAPLKYGVGHLFGYPGKGGKILVYGHSSSYPWDVSSYTKIFRQINKLNVGDTINVTFGGNVHTYQVSYKQTVPVADMSAYQGGGGEELILYTCWPPDSIKERYLVHAKPVAEVAQR